MVLTNQKEALLGQQGLVVWLYGLSGAGKSTLARALDDMVFERGGLTQILDGDVLRKGLNSNLGFTMEDRAENIRRTAEAARLLADTGILVIAALITPTRQLRTLARGIVGAHRFLEVYLKCSYECASSRDVKGLYARATSGALANFTGKDSPFEPPDTDGSIILDTETRPLEECCDRLMREVLARTKLTST
jgi:adenylylsulfate kinase